MRLEECPVRDGVTTYRGLVPFFLLQILWAGDDEPESSGGSDSSTLERLANRGGVLSFPSSLPPTASGSMTSRPSRVMLKPTRGA